VASDRQLQGWLAAAGLAIGAVACAADEPRLPPPMAVEPCPPETPADARRQRAGDLPEAFRPTPCNPAALAPPPAGSSPDFAGMPDRWRIVSVVGYPENLLDPYHGNNWLKGDRPAWGEDGFVSLSAISDTVVEPRRIPTPRAGPVTEDPGDLDQVGDGGQLVLAQSFIFEGVLYKGNTVFMPPEYELRVIPVVNLNHARAQERGVLRAPASTDTTRSDAALGLQALFLDKHLRDVSPRYDFDSLRIGIQPFTADFRGFLFNDAPFGVRLFGIRGNNRYQYNLAWLRRLEKDTNSGLNDPGGGLRDDDVFAANLYVQDFPSPGFTSQLSLTHNRNREGDETFYDDNGFIQRPASFGTGQGRDYDVTYLGYGGDGHFRRFNLSLAAYGALGDESHGTFTTAGNDVRALFAAAEVSRDFDWVRGRLSLLYASGDDDPFDDRATGFDAILENPLFAGADTSFWIRQAVPLIGGGRVGLAGRNGVLASLRSSKEFGQSNFTNPGTMLLGVGADLDMAPTLRLALNANELWFEDTAAVEAARGQSGIGRHIGLDLSAALTWRPLAIQNVVVRLSAAALVPGAGYEALFGDDWSYSILGNVVLAY
jgi:hypothetical protein